MYSKEKGQGLVEYALVILVVALLVVISVMYLAPEIGNMYTEIGETVTPL